VIGLILGGCGHIVSGAKSHTYELDGQQSVMVGFCLANRISIIDSSWSSLNLSSGWATSISQNASLARGFIKILNIGIFGSKDLSTHSNKFIKKFEEVCCFYEKNFDFFINKAAPYFEIVYVVSNIALIFFGHTMIGAVGIINSIILELKKRGRLPAELDWVLVPLSKFARLYNAFGFKINIISKSVLLFEEFINACNYFISCDLIDKLIFRVTGKNFSVVGSHDIHQGKGFNDKLKETQKLSDLLSCIENLKINETSKHASYKLVLDDFQKHLDDITYEHLYKKLEERISSTCALDSSKNIGWDRLKNALLNNCCPDLRPENFQYSRNMIKALLYGVLNEKNDEIFKYKIQEFDDIGSSCHDGWLRSILFLYNPNAKEIGWNVHFEHAKFRSALIQEGINEVVKSKNEVINKIEKKAPQLFESILTDVGGKGNVHLSNEIQSCVWSQWRSFEGELFYKINGRDLFTKLAQELLKNYEIKDLIAFIHAIENNLREKNLSSVFKDWIVLFFLSFKVPTLITAGGPYSLIFVIEVFKTAKKNYTKERLVERFYDAIYPEINFEERGESDEGWVSRGIQWDAIATWLATLQQRDVEGILLQDDNYNPQIVKVTPENLPYLTHKGVELLLWDFGVLEL
jgi:hypothetical protein